MQMVLMMLILLRYNPDNASQACTFLGSAETQRGIYETCKLTFQTFPNKTLIFAIS